MTKNEIRMRIIEIFHELHKHPELALEEVWTSKYIGDTMEALGFTVARGIGKTGLVATLKCGDSPAMIGLRADFDALPIEEATSSPWKSQNPGCFHGCGHDSHVATMIGAALLLQESQDFNGTVAFVFQPGEEPGVGAKAMIDDGLFEKFPIREIYGQHNGPSEPFGRISLVDGKNNASEDDFWITIKGRGGQASAPHRLQDPIPCAVAIVSALQTIVSRNIDPHHSATCTVCDISTDGAMNTTPSTVKMLGDCRTYDPADQDFIEKRMREIIKSTCEAYNCEGELVYKRVFPPVLNDSVCTQVVLDTARELFGEDAIMLGSELFAQIVRRRLPKA